MGRIFVTGATGFLGRHLVDQLLEDGHEVTVLVRKNPAPPLPSKVVICYGDIADKSRVRNACEGCARAFHCAGIVSRDHADAEELRRVHLIGTEVALSAMREAGVERVVIVSTSGTVAVGIHPGEIRGEDAEAPLHLIQRWPYYHAKYLAEEVALKHNSPSSFEVICVLPTLLLGPGDLNESSTGDVRKFLQQRIPFRPAGGLSFVDVRDAAAALRLAMDKGRPGHRYLLSCTNMSLSDFFFTVAQVSGVRAPRLALPRNPVAVAGATGALLNMLGFPVNRIDAEMAQVYWYVDPSRAKQELGWETRDPVETIRSTVEDLWTRGVVLRRAVDDHPQRNSICCCCVRRSAREQLLNSPDRSVS